MSDMSVYNYGQPVTIARRNGDGLMQCAACAITFGLAEAFARRFQLDDQWHDRYVQQQCAEAQAHYLAEHTDAPRCGCPAHDDTRGCRARVDKHGRCERCFNAACFGRRTVTRPASPP